MTLDVPVFIYSLDLSTSWQFAWKYGRRVDRSVVLKEEAGGFMEAVRDSLSHLSLSPRAH